MLKKFLIISILVLSLNSCFFKAEEDEKIEKNQKVTNTENSTENKLITISGDGFLIKLPKLSKVNDLPKPRVGKVVLAMQSKEMRDGFINNIIIIKQKLKKKMSSEEFSIVNQVKAKTKYTNYKKIETSDFIFEDGENSVLYIFEARYNSSSAKHKFLQIGRVCANNEAYIITIGLNISVRNFDKYKDYIKSFKCKK